MMQPQPLTRILHYPVTAALIAAALTVTGIWWSGHDIEGLFMTSLVWEKLELWRAFTSTLPHVDFFHLAFNLYWLWIFGTFLEKCYGHIRLVGIFALLAFTSSTGEFIFLDGGVGLSGIGYGLWGLLWALEKNDPAFHGVLDQKTTRIFVVWFFLCIALTVTNVMPVANIAHGVGAGTGALLGLAMSSKPVIKRKCYAGLIVIVFLCVVGSTSLWPWINLSGYAEAEIERAGLSALDRGEISKAVKRLETAAHMRGAPARAWYNLGIAYHRQNRYDHALVAYEQAAKMPDATSEFQQSAKEMRTYWNNLKPFEK